MMGNELDASERARASLFEVMGRPPWPSPWRPVRAPDGVTAGYATAIEGHRYAAAYLRLEVRAKADEVCALILDSRGTGLAGDLLEWTAESIDDHRQRLQYTVALPALLRPRRFHIIQRTARQGDVHWLFSQDDPNATPTDDAGVVPARLERSDYRMVELPHGGLRFERIIALDLGLPAPLGLFARMLGREQLVDAKRLHVALTRGGRTRS